MKKARYLLLSLISVCIGLVLAVVGLELGLRLFPVETSPFVRSMTAKDDVLRADPNSTMLFSSGWNFKNPHRASYNNDGFLNDQDYMVNGVKPLIAVIGDSYIEAKMVEYPETLQGRLKQHVGELGRVYSFAMSGAPLSQYLMWIKYARSKYGADAVIINVVGNDFDQSLAKYKIRDGFYHYYHNSSGDLELHLSEYEPSLIRKIALHSALARYLVFHLRVRGIWRDIKGGITKSSLGNSSGPQNANAKEARMAIDSRVGDSVAMLKAFFRDLHQMSGLSPDKILFVVDANRDKIYHPERYTKNSQSYFGTMRDLFITLAREKGHPVVDMKSAFEEDYRVNGKAFDFPYDAHWSAYGHEVAYRAIIKSGWLKSLSSNANQ